MLQNRRVLFFTRLFSVFTGFEQDRPERRTCMSRFLRFLLFLGILLIIVCSCSAEDVVIDPQWPVPDYVTLLLDIASGEVGYEEGEHGWTKYGEWVGDPYCQWCAEFLCWCVDQVDQRYGTSLLNHVYPLYSGSNEGRAWFITAGRYVIRKGEVEDWGYEWLKGHTDFISSGDYIPQPGDWVFFTWTSDDDTDHVAMVEYCTQNTLTGEIMIHVIEGNKPDAVARDVYELDYGRILGYGTVHDVADIMMHVGNRGEKVRQLQEKLIFLGILDPQYESGVFDSATLSALRTFQSGHGLRCNGWANMETQLVIDEAVQQKIENDPASWTVTDDE